SFCSQLVIPAKAGIPRADSRAAEKWVPAFAGTTDMERSCENRKAARLSIIRDLDEVLVRVADIDRLDRPDGAGARSRSGDDRHLATLQVRDDLGDRHLGDEAQIARARGRPVGDETGDVVGRVQVDLLLAEAQRGASLAEFDDLHAEDARV